MSPRGILKATTSLLSEIKTRPIGFCDNYIESDKIERFNPTRGRGTLNACPEEKLRFWHLFVIQMTQKN